MKVMEAFSCVLMQANLFLPNDRNVVIMERIIWVVLKFLTQMLWITPCRFFFHHKAFYLESNYLLKLSGLNTCTTGTCH